MTIVDRLKYANPLRCDTTGLPVNVLLVAKLFVLSLWFKGYLRHGPRRTVPFIEKLGEVGTEHQFSDVMLGMIFVGVIMLFSNTKVRFAVFLIGLALLLRVFGNMSAFANSRLYGACFLLLIGVYELRWGIWLLRWQVLLLYFGAGLNKLLDPDWLSGVYFESWMHDKLQHETYVWASAMFPPMLLSRFLGNLCIVLELGIFVAFLRTQWYRYAIWLVVFFHGAALLLTDEDFGSFFSTILISMLVFAEWPDRVEVITGTDRAKPVIQLLKRLDFTNMYSWTSSGNVGLRVRTNNRESTGFRAVQDIFFWNPLSYFFAVTMLTMPNGELLWIRNFAFVLFVLFAVPWPNGTVENQRQLTHEERT